MVTVAERVSLRQRRGGDGAAGPIQTMLDTPAGAATTGISASVAATTIPTGLVLGVAAVAGRPSESSLDASGGKERGKKVTRLLPGDGVTEVEAPAKRRRLDPSSSRATVELPAVEVGAPAVEVGAPADLAPDEAFEAVFESESSSAALYAMVGCPGHEFPSVDSLSRSSAYSELAHQGVKFIAALNSFTLGYESQASKALKTMDNLRQNARAYKTRYVKAERRIKDLDCIVATHRKDYEDLEGRHMELESDLAAARSQVDDLTARLAEANQLQRGKVQMAVHDASCALVAKFGERTAQAKAKIDDMMSAPWQRLLDYTEVKCNLELIGQMRDETLVPPFDLALEEASLVQQMEVLGGASESFIGLVTGLEQLLEFPSGKMVSSEMVELAAASIGVGSLFGSNGGVVLVDEQAAEEATTSPVASDEDATEEVREDATEDVVEDIAEDVAEDVVEDDAEVAVETVAEGVASPSTAV